MTVLTVKFQVYLMYILGDIENQISYFYNFFTFSSFFQGMQFPDNITVQFSPCYRKKFQMYNLISFLIIYNIVNF